MDTVGCDPGSRSQIKSKANNQCAVWISANGQDFVVDMTLACAETGHRQCYEIVSLTCQGNIKTVSAPIVIDDCPGEAWCIDDCDDALGSPGTLWDIPALLAVDGCNIYDD